MKEIDEHKKKILERRETELIVAYEAWKKIVNENDEMNGKGLVNQEENRVVLRILADAAMDLYSLYESNVKGTASARPRVG